MDFVILSSIDWVDQDGAHRPTQLGRALAALGHRILFVELGCLPLRRESENIRITSLGALGMPERDLQRARLGFEDYDLSPVLDCLGAELDRFEQSERRTVIWEMSFPPYVRLWDLFKKRGYSTVYDAIDDFRGAERFGLYYANMIAERFLVENADVVLAVTQVLAERFALVRQGAPVELFSNGVNPEFRAVPPPPPDLLRGEVTLGFWGPLQGFTVDGEALAYVAHARPNWTINLIGQDDFKSTPQVTAPLEGLANVRVLGKRPHDVLSNYLYGFDVCLVPFPDNTFSRARDPLKMYEYLAGYKPVVALHTPHLQGIPYVSVAGSHQEFLEQCDRASRMPVDHQVVDKFLQANSWTGRAYRLLELVEETPHQQATGVHPPERMEDAASLVERTRTYVEYLEWASAERLAYAQHVEKQAAAMNAYILKLERTHPLIWIKRLLNRVTSKRA